MNKKQFFVLRALLLTGMALSVMSTPADTVQNNLPSTLVSRLMESDTALVAGTSEADAKLTIIEFSDPLCPYCRANKKKIDELLSIRTDLRVIYRENPLHSSKPRQSAIALVAAQKQNKEADMQKALLTRKRFPSVSEIESAAAEIGLDVTEFRKTMADKDVILEAESWFPTRSFSNETARAIYATIGIEKQLELRDAVYASRPPFSIAAVEKIVESVGIDYAQLSPRMSSDAMDVLIETNYQLAHELGITGTPYYVLIGPTRSTRMRGWDEELIHSFFAE